MTNTSNWTPYDQFGEALDALHAFGYMLGDTLDQANLPDRVSAGITELLTGQLQTLDDVKQTLHAERIAQRNAERAAKDKETGLVPMTPQERRELREANIRQIMRDADYTAVAKARGLDPVMVRDLLYDLMAAPQKHPEEAGDGRKTMDTMMPAPSELAAMHGPIPEHFEEEAIRDRLTGDTQGLESNAS